MEFVLEFERPLVELQKRIETLLDMERSTGANLRASIEQLRQRAERLEGQIFEALTPWQRTQLSRHPGRPYTLDYAATLCTEWTEIAGDRAGHDDAAIVGGMARFDGRPIAIIGHQKGRNTKENIRRNFGMPRPEGYRKALRIMQLANRFQAPIVTFIDTAGAYPGIEAEERGQAEAIARNIMEMAALTVPILCCVIGEGGSGGALAIGVGNRVMMLENSIYSVISPEGCAAILWRDRADAPRAAEVLRITARDCMELGVIDEVIPEPSGGAHRRPEEAIQRVGEVLRRQLRSLDGLDGQGLRQQRYDRFRAIGALLGFEA